MTIETKIAQTIGILGLVGLFGVGLLDEMTAKPKTVVSVRSKTESAPFNILNWDCYVRHDLTFEDGTESVVTTRDYDWAFIKDLIGYRNRHPQVGDEYLFGGVFGERLGRE